MEISYSIEQLNSTANAVWELAKNARVIAFHGAMGAGKTSLIHALCKVKQVKDTVGSPTFSIINEYYYLESGEEKKIYHIDVYRLQNEAEAVQAGVEDALFSDHTCLVEWPEKIPGLLPEETKHVFIEVVDERSRRLRIGDY